MPFTYDELQEIRKNVLIHRQFVAEALKDKITYPNVSISSNLGFSIQANKDSTYQISIVSVFGEQIVERIQLSEQELSELRESVTLKQQKRLAKFEQAQKDTLEMQSKVTDTNLAEVKKQPSLSRQETLVQFELLFIQKQSDIHSALWKLNKNSNTTTLSSNESLELDPPQGNTFHLFSKSQFSATSKIEKSDNPNVDISISDKQAHALIKLNKLCKVIGNEWKIDKKMASQVQDGSMYLNFDDERQANIALVGINEVYGKGCCRTSGAGPTYVKIDANTANGQKAINEIFCALEGEKTTSLSKKM